MWYLERQAIRDNLINIEVARTGADDAEVEAAHAADARVMEKTFLQKCYQVYEEADTIGLILLGFGWALVSPQWLVTL